MIINTFLLLCLLLGCTLVGLGQQEARTSDGRVVILNPDGTWKLKVAKKAEPATSENADDCSKWTMSTTDKVTGTTTLSGKPGFVVSDDGKTGFRIITMRSNRSIILNFTVVAPGSSCIDKDAKINLLFRDGSREEIIANSKFNCDGDVTVYFRGVFGNEGVLDKLKTKPVETIRIRTYKSFVDKDLTPAQSERLMRELSCLDYQ